MASITATHILLEPTTKWHLKAWHSTDFLGLFKVGPRCWHHPYLLNSSPIMNIDVYNNARIRAPVSARTLCQQRLHERNPGRLSQIGLGNQWYSNPELPVGLANRKYKDYVYRKMLVQEYLKKWRIFKRVKPKNDMMFHDIYNCICQNTKK